MGSDRAFAAAQRAWDNAEPPPDTRECDSCDRQRDRGAAVDGRWLCEGCLRDDGRCESCGQPLEDRDGLGSVCRYCEPSDDDE